MTDTPRSQATLARVFVPPSPPPRSWSPASPLEDHTWESMDFDDRVFDKSDRHSNHHRQAYEHSPPTTPSDYSPVSDKAASPATSPYVSAVKNGYESGRSRMVVPSRRWTPASPLEEYEWVDDVGDEPITYPAVLTSSASTSKSKSASATQPRGTTTKTKKQLENERMVPNPPPCGRCCQSCPCQWQRKRH